MQKNRHRMINGHDLRKIRVCDLKRGDEFLFYGREKRVTSVSGVVRFVDEYGRTEGLSANSQQWVELMPEHEQIRVDKVNKRCIR